MSLTKGDLKEIRTVVKDEVSAGVKEAKNEIIATLSNEITDLAEINRAVIERMDKISELEKRIIRIEHKIGIAI